MEGGGREMMNSSGDYNSYCRMLESYHAEYMQQPTEKGTKGLLNV